MGRIVLRCLVAAAIAVGLLLGWSSQQPVFDLDAWKEQQARALEASRPVEAAGQVVPSPTVEASPVPTPSATSTPGTVVPTSTPAASASPTPTLSSPVDSPPEPLFPLTETPTLPGTSIETEIQASGGRLDTPDGQLTIEFPDAALSERLLVRATYEDLSQLKPFIGSELLTAWEFKAFALDRGSAVVDQFPTGIRITIRYSEPELRGLNPETLRLWTFNETTDNWDTLPSTPVAGTGTVYVDVDHFSIDAGTADPAVPSQNFLSAFQTSLQTGASSVSLPIEVPPGPGGLQPTLTLSYSSNTVNEMKSREAQGSWVGVGWNLSVGSVHRVWADTPGSTVRRSRYFLELNGIADEIIAFPSDPNFPYRLKHEQFIRIRRDDPDPLTNLDCNPTETPIDDDRCGWIVTDKEGHVYRFGTGTTNNFRRWYTYYWSGPPAGWSDYFYQWDLESVADTHSNQINYTYWRQTYNDCGGSPCRPYILAAYPILVDYNSGLVRIELDSCLSDNAYPNCPNGSDYQNCPTPNPPGSANAPSVCMRPDTPRDYGGTPACHLAPKVMETRRLDQIRIKVNSSLVRRYDFGYTTTNRQPACDGGNFWAGQLMLQSFEQRGSSNGVLSTMQFTYGDYSYKYWATYGTPFATFNRKFLTKATTGLAGASATYAYTEKDPATNLSWTRIVVNSKTLDFDGASNQTLQPNQTVTYDYDSGGVYHFPPDLNNQPDRWNAGFRGFGQVTETTPAPNSIKTVHKFRTTGGVGSIDEKLSGTEYETSTYAAGTPDAQWEKIVRDYVVIERAWRNDPNDPDHAIGSSNSIHLTQVTRTLFVRTQLHPEGTASNTIVTQYDYDAYDNMITEHQLGEYGDTTDDRTVDHQYTAPALYSTWVHVPQFERRYAGNGTTGSPVSDMEYVYDGDVNTTTGDRLRVRSGAGTPYSYTYEHYDSKGNRTQESVPTTVLDSGSTIPSGVPYTQWTYDATTLNTYPAKIERLKPNGSSIPTGDLQTTTITWNLVLGRPETRSEPNISGSDNNIVQMRYDEFGRLTKTWDSVFGSESSPAMLYVYFWAESIPYTLTYHYSSHSPTDQYTWESSCFDGFGREFQTRSSYKPSIVSATERGYDGRGLVRFESQPFQDTSLAGPGGFPGACFAFGDYVSNRDIFAYNALGALAVTVHSSDISNWLINDYQGLTNTVTDENRHRDSYRYDAFGRLAEVTEIGGDDSPNWPYFTATATRYEHDPSDNLTRVTDQLNNQTIITYDSLGRKATLQEPNMINPTTQAHEHWTYDYDVAGNLTTQTDARGQIVRMVYDALNRLTKKCYNISASSCASATVLGDGVTGLVALYYYDSAGFDSIFCGSGNAGTATGRLGKMVDTSGTTLWCYDKRGRVVKESHTVENGTIDPSFTIVRAYDALDRPTTVTYPDGEQVLNTYDSISGLATGLQHVSPGTSFNYVSGATYDPAFRLDTQTLGNGVGQNYDYDPQRGWINQINSTKPPAIGGGYLKTLQYAHDSVGNVTRISDPDLSPTLTDFTYDWYDRLTGTGQSHAYTAIYEYSPIGNLTHTNEGGYDLHSVYDGLRPHAVDKIYNSSTPSPANLISDYDYDANGNVISITGGPVNTDTDKCTDHQERGPDQGSCGRRDPQDKWDVYDPAEPDGIPGWSPGDGNGTVDLFNDIFGVAFRLGLTSADAGYDATWDRSPPNAAGADPWDAGPPDGIIDLFNDIFGVAFQFGATNRNLPTYAYTYDAENRLVVSRAAGFTTTYVYDGQGQLIKTAGGDTTLYAGGIEEMTGTQVTKYYSFGGRRIAVNNSGTLRYLLADGLGSTTMTLDGSGNPVYTQDYFPYGRARGHSTVSSTTDKQFTGHQQEQGETYFMQSRFYDALAGRFLQPDTIVPDSMNPQALNRYSYVLGNPLRYTDPTGHCHGEPLSFEDDQLCFDRLGEITWRDAPPVPREVSEHPGPVPAPEGGSCGAYVAQCAQNAMRNARDASAEQAKAARRYVCRQFPELSGCENSSCLTVSCLLTGIQAVDTLPIGVLGVTAPVGELVDLGAAAAGEIQIIGSDCSYWAKVDLTINNMGNLGLGTAGNFSLAGDIPLSILEGILFGGNQAKMASC